MAARISYRTLKRSQISGNLGLPLGERTEQRDSEGNLECERGSDIPELAHGQAGNSHATRNAEEDNQSLVSLGLILVAGSAIRNRRLLQHAPHKKLAHPARGRTIQFLSKFGEFSQKVYS